jgi:hypothetical protein
LLIGQEIKGWELPAKGENEESAGFLARQMESRRREERNAEDDAVRRGWCLGSEEFRRELLEAAQERVGGSHYGGERQASGEEKAQRLVRGGNSIGGA